MGLFNKAPKIGMHMVYVYNSMLQKEGLRGKDHTIGDLSRGVYIREKPIKIPIG